MTFEKWPLCGRRSQYRFLVAWLDADEENVMGGGWTELRGPTKIAVWEQLEELIHDEGDVWSIYPRSKKDAKRRMEREYPSRDWVLRVRLDK